MPAALVADRGSNLSDGNSPYTVTITSPTAITVGNHLIMPVGWEDDETVASITDARNTWQVDATIASTTSHRVSICSVFVAVAYQAADTLTINASAAGPEACMWELNEFSGLATTSWFDTSQTNASTGVTLDTGTTATLAQADSLGIGAFSEGAGANTTWTPDGDWTALGAQATAVPVRGLLAAYKVLAATTGEQLGGTHPNTSFAGAIAIYKAAVAAPAGPPVGSLAMTGVGR